MTEFEKIVSYINEKTECDFFEDAGIKRYAIITCNDAGFGIEVHYYFDYESHSLYKKHNELNKHNGYVWLVIDIKNKKTIEFEVTESITLDGDYIVDHLISYFPDFYNIEYNEYYKRDKA